MAGRCFPKTGPQLKADLFSEAMAVLPIRQVFQEAFLGIRSMIVAACAAIGIGQAAEAAASRCEYSDHYDPPEIGIRENYDFDLYFREGFIGSEETPISSYGIYMKDVAVPMRATITHLAADYCADISLSSLGQVWDVTSSLMSVGLDFIAYGNSPDDGNFLFSLSNQYGSYGSYLDLEYRTDDAYTWVLLDIDNVRVSPVPLPTTAALLPLGLGALAVMRRRRRRVS